MHSRCRFCKIHNHHTCIKVSSNRMKVNERVMTTYRHCGLNLPCSIFKFSCCPSFLLPQMSRKTWPEKTCLGHVYRVQASRCFSLHGKVHIPQDILILEACPCREWGGLRVLAKMKGKAQVLLMLERLGPLLSWQAVVPFLLACDPLVSK